MGVGLPSGSLKNIGHWQRPNIQLLTQALSGITIIFLPDKEPKYRTPGNPRWEEVRRQAELAGEGRDWTSLGRYRQRTTAEKHQAGFL